jgi:tetratricopeptide (TPR) repeat protein
LGPSGSITGDKHLSGKSEHPFGKSGGEIWTVLKLSVTSRMMSKRSQQIDAWFRQGQQRHLAGRLAEAEQIYRQILAVMPRHADTLHALSALALQAGRPEAAERLVDQAISLRPAAQFRLTRANVLLALRRPSEAVAACRIALKARPSSAEAHQILGHALADMGSPEEAIFAYREALRLNPNLPDIRNNIGTALRLANRLEEAEAELSLASPDPLALVNLSSLQKERGKIDAAETTLRRAFEMAPDDPVLLYNWSLLMHLDGRPAEAWPGWEHRFRAGAVPPRSFTRPQWDGDDLNGRRLLVHAEQGLGDVIQFCRYLPAIRGSLVFEAPARLIRLLSANPAMPPMIAAGSTLPEFDVVAPLMSLPARMQAAPVAPPYVFPERERVELWRDRLGDHGFRVGIAWQGFPGRHEDKGRSLPLACFAPLAAIPDVRLISLQRLEGEEQIATVPFRVETLPDLDAGPDAFIDTAAVMMSLDLVVTSDTSIPHLAGALGRPVWVALRKVPDWRWMLDREDSPWYPTMRLFRQTIDGEWGRVFTAIADAMGKLR